MTLVLELPDAWKQLLGLDHADAAGRAGEMLVIESWLLPRRVNVLADELDFIAIHCIPFL
jgi:hypothetical protein